MWLVAIFFLAYGSEAFNRLPLIFGFALISFAPGLLELGGVFPPQKINYYVYGFTWFNMAISDDILVTEEKVEDDIFPDPPLQHRI